MTQRRATTRQPWPSGGEKALGRPEILDRRMFVVRMAAREFDVRFVLRQRSGLEDRELVASAHLTPRRLAQHGQGSRARMALAPWRITNLHPLSLSLSTLKVLPQRLRQSSAPQPIASLEMGFKSSKSRLISIHFWQFSRKNPPEIYRYRSMIESLEPNSRHQRAEIYNLSTQHRWYSIALTLISTQAQG